ncbi:MAG: DUF814 domain-containing protein, partial [Candidatus Cloacimonetes bacterium]|nr:DUF814 domain-containing protein [Candidatus Cloacimonadota bacterium]
SNLTSISIPLFKEKSPQENLNFYLKKYRKAKQGKEKLASQIKQTYEEISQIKSILVMFESNIWQDLITQDADVFQTTSHLKKADNLFRLPVNKDWEIVIGRKATENDFISTQLGKPNDWWFHTRIYRGSHILLRNYHKLELPPPLCELCCRLAAWFSKARNSSNVPVDYTQIRFVRKPRKSAPGYVTYSSHKTIFAEPLEPAAAKEVIRQYVEQD